MKNVLTIYQKIFVKNWRKKIFHTKKKISKKMKKLQEDVEVQTLTYFSEIVEFQIECHCKDGEAENSKRQSNFFLFALDKPPGHKVIETPRFKIRQNKGISFE